MKSKFKVGDRVAVYDQGCRKVGVVHATYSDERNQVIVAFGDIADFYHPKQLRRLVKRSLGFKEGS